MQVKLWFRLSIFRVFYSLNTKMRFSHWYLILISPTFLRSLINAPPQDVYQMKVDKLIFTNIWTVPKSNNRTLRNYHISNLNSFNFKSGDTFRLMKQLLYYNHCNKLWNRSIIRLTWWSRLSGKTYLSIHSQCSFDFLCGVNIKQPL